MISTIKTAKNLLYSYYYYQSVNFKSSLLFFMNEHNRDSIGKAYQSINNRNIDVILLLMHNNVQWPQDWEGSFITGHEQLKEYWTKQWLQISPTVKPLSLKENTKGQIKAMVHQIIKIWMVM